MRAYVHEGYFHLYIEEIKEIKALMEKPLEANLKRELDGSDLEKKIVLRYEQNSQSPSFDISPKESPSWDKLEEICVAITKEQYEKLKDEKMCVCRFDGGFSIDLYTDRMETITPEEDILMVA